MNRNGDNEGGAERPAGWANVRLGELLDKPLINGRSVRSLDGGFPVLRLTALKADGIDLTEQKQGEWTSTEAEPFLVAQGDFLAARGNGSLDLVGRGALVTAVPSPVAFPDTMIRIRTMHALVEPRYLKHLWDSRVVRQQIERSARTTAGIYKINQSMLERVELPLPPRAEQSRIVDALDAHLASLDTIAARLRAVVTTLERLETKIMSRASTGLLAPHTEPQPASIDRVGVIDGQLPATAPGWSWARLRDIAEVVGGVTKDSKKQSDPGLPEVPYLRVANVQRATLDLSHIAKIRVADKVIKKLTLRAGDVLMTEGGDRDKLGRGWVWEGQIPGCIHQNHIFRARITDEAVLHPKLLAWYANSAAKPWFEANGKQSVNLASISISTVKLLPIPLPPAGMQAELVKAGEEALGQIGRLVNVCQGALAHVTTLRQALLSEAFAGRLVAQNPDDEPAEAMLKRIHVEREAAEAARRAARRQTGHRTVGRTASVGGPAPAARTNAVAIGEQTILDLDLELELNA